MTNPEGLSLDASILPAGWSAIERVEDVVDTDGLRLHRTGLASRSAGGEALGAAADWKGSPTTRSWFELLERVSLLDAIASPAAEYLAKTRAGDPLARLGGAEVFPISDEPARWAYARSSGVALHQSWESACVRAAEELAERDRVLRSWLGETRPERLAFDLAGSPFARTRSYEWRAYAFPGEGPGPLARAQVAGIFGFPTTREAPFVFGYGARASLPMALEAAAREAAQLLAFLWGEPVSERPPEPTPTPAFHLETYQVHENAGVLRRWLDEGHGAHRAARPPAAPARDVVFVDLTPAWLAGKLHVAKAMCDDALPLAFGSPPFVAHLPAELRVHPIP